MFLLGGGSKAKAARSASSSKAANPPVTPKDLTEESFNDCDLDQFMSEGLDVASILNDQSLHDELAELGWGQENPIVPTSKPASKPSTSAARPPPAPAPAPEEDLLDIGDLGVVDEASIQLDDQDMIDPELLNMYALLGGDHAPIVVASDALEPEPELISSTLRARPVVQDSSSSFVSSDPVDSPGQTQEVDPAYVASLSLDEVRTRAVEHKRKGNTAEALRWYRYVKQMEQARSSQAPPTKPPKPALLTSQALAPTSLPTPAPTRLTSAQLAPAPTITNIVIAPPAVVKDEFSSLEAALLEASKSSLAKAKALREADPKAAVERKRDYDRYQQELAVLVSRRGQPGARPALFKWETIRKETKVERLEIGETELKVVITALSALENVLKDHGSRDLSLELDLNMAASKDGDARAVISVPKARYSDGRVDFNFEVVLPILRRTKLVAQTFARKKATFEVVLHRGMFRSNQVLCVGTLPLSDLVTKSEVTGPFPLFAPSADAEGKTKKGVAIGGALEAKVTIRSPLGGPEVSVVEERRLVVDTWPPVQHAFVPLPAAPAPGPVPALTPTAPVPAPAAPLQSQSSVAGTAAFGVALTEREKVDPESPEFLESNDVLEAHILEVETRLQRGVDEDERFTLGLRLDMLRTKLQMLVFKVQSEQLSMDEYLALLRERVARDKALALHFKGLSTAEDTQQAVRIMRRIKTMQEEIQNAEEVA